MHELSLARAIVDTAVRHAGGARVTAVRVRAGQLRQVVPESLTFYFTHVARETLCEGARLEVEAVPACLRCRDCEHEWQLEEAVFRCPCCAGTDVNVGSGEELEVDSIEIEEEACTASA